MINNLYKTIILLLMAAGLCFNAAAQDDTAGKKLGVMSLKELLNVKIVTASKTSQSAQEAPATVIVVTAEQIKMRGYQSLLDVMNDLPDVKVDDKVYSMIRNSFTLRGIQGMEKFTILLDGISISTPSFEAMPIMENYPVNLAEQIEIVFGPASALYGANAVSGVINIITKKNNSKKSLIVEASSIGGTYGYTNTTLFLAKKINEHVSFVISGQYAYDKGVDLSKVYKDDSALNVDSYSTGTVNSIYGPMTPLTPIHSPNYEAPMKAGNIYGALHIDDFTFSFFRNDFTIPTAFGSNTSNALYNKDAFMRQSISTATSSFKKTLNKVTSTTSLSISRYELNPKSNYRNLYTGFEPAYKYSLASMARAEQQLDFKATDKLDLTGGVSYEIYNVIPQSTDLSNPVNKNDYINGTYLGTQSYYLPEGIPAQFYYLKYHNIGSYLQAQYSPLDKLNITLGARYDINSRYGNTFNPRMGIVWKPFNTTTIKALYGSAFLAPSGSDCYAQYGSFYTQDSGQTFNSYFLHLPNSHLKPITSKNAELSIHQYISDNFSATLNGYYTTLTGLHAFADDNTSTKIYNNTFNGIPVDYVEVFINQNRQKNYGGSLRLNWKWTYERIHGNAYASLSYVNGIIDNALKENDETEPDKRPEFISPYMLHAGVDIKRGKLSFAPRVIWMGKQNISGIADSSKSILICQTIPGYVLVNLSLRYSIVKRFATYINVSNALNQKYRNVGFNMDKNNKNTDGFYGQPQDPIRIMGGVSFTF